MMVVRNMDFEVNFNPNVNVTTLVQVLSTLTALKDLICNIFSLITVGSSSSYSLTLISMPLNVLTGVAVDGVTTLDANSLNEVDPFYPAGGISPEGADECLSHPAVHGVFH
jgi:hypothetical protein